MSCITKLLEMKGDKEFLPFHSSVVIEGGGTYKDHEFLIAFTYHGSRCGYVAIPSGVKYDSDEIQVHGWITFEGKHNGAKDLLTTPCNDIWIGFDAAHWGDTRDYEKAKKYFGHNEEEKIQINLSELLYKDVDKLERQDSYFSHKTFDYMVSECKSVIDQLIAQRNSI